VTVCREQSTFSFHSRKSIVADFEGGLITSDAGLLPVRELDARLSWSEQMAHILADPRQGTKVNHTVQSLFRQRLFGLIAGYEDANDHTRLRHDPLLRAIVGERGNHPLASQPTLSRFENAITARQVAQLNRFLVEMFIQRRHKRRPKRIVLDLDPTDDPCHGHQQLALFNGFYDQYMYLPALVFERESGMLLGVRLQPGNAPASYRALALLKPIIRRLRKKWPKVKILIRADAGLATPRFYDFCEMNEVEYLIGLPATQPLKEQTDWAIHWSTERFERDGEPCHWRGGFRHQAKSWPRPRRILYKVEVNTQGVNRRFVVTNCRGLPVHLWPQYDDRGTAETFIDELKNGLAMDRLSCRRFVANAFRLVLAAAAYNLLRALRQTLAGTELEHASVQTIRSRLIKIGARVRWTVRRVWVHLASGFPLRQLWQKLCQAIAAQPPPCPA